MTQIPLDIERVVREVLAELKRAPLVPCGLCSSAGNRLGKPPLTPILPATANW